MAKSMDLVGWLLVALLPACGGDSAPIDASVGDAPAPVICPDGVDSYDPPVRCDVLGQTCVTATGAYPYGAKCIGCAPPYRWETDAVEVMCDGGS